MNKEQSVKIKSPYIASKFLTWASPAHLKDPVLGDMSEEFYQRVEKHGVVGAKRWYWQQSILSGVRFMLATKQNMVTFSVSLLVFMIVMIWLAILGGSVVDYISIPSVVAVIPLAVLFTVAATSKTKVSKAFNALINQDLDLSSDDLKTSKRVFSILGNTALLLGFFTTLMGWVSIGVNMDDINAFGPAFAVSILTLMYGIAMKLLCYVAEQKMQTLIE